MPSQEEVDAGQGKGGSTGRSSRERSTMSQITGIKKPLCHANSLLAETVPKHGVETTQEAELGKVGAVDGDGQGGCVGEKCVNGRDIALSWTG